MSRNGHVSLAIGCGGHLLPITATVNLASWVATTCHAGRAPHIHHLVVSQFESYMQTREAEGE